MKTKTPQIKQVIELDGKYYEVTPLKPNNPTIHQALSEAFERSISQNNPIAMRLRDGDWNKNKEDSLEGDAVRYAVSLKPKKKVRGKYREALTNLDKGETKTYPTSSVKEKRTIYQGVYSAAKVVKGLFEVSAKGDKVTAKRLR